VWDNVYSTGSRVTDTRNKKITVVPHLRVNTADFLWKTPGAIKPESYDSADYPEGWDWDSKTEWAAGFYLAVFASIFWGPAYLNRCYTHYPTPHEREEDMSF